MKFEETQHSIPNSSTFVKHNNENQLSLEPDHETQLVSGQLF
jgi:hypothetical protein